MADSTDKISMPSGDPAQLGDPAPGIWRRVLQAIVLVVVIAVLYLVNHHAAQNRVVYLVNGSDRPVTVDVDGQQFVLSHRGPLKITLPEGTHSVVYSGGIEGKAQITIEGGLSERFFSSTVYVLNPMGKAIVAHETMEYVRADLAKEDAATDATLHYGTDLVRLEDIDYVFEEFPREIRLDRNQRRATKTRVFVVDLSRTHLFAWLVQQKSMVEALRFAEDQLGRHPEDTTLLTSYVYVNVGTEHRQRVMDVLKAGCEARPIRYAWHEVWHDLQIQEGKYDELAASYKALLTAAPEDPDLLCLNARLQLRSAEWSKLVQRALEADPNHAIALGRMACRHAELGDWPQARSLAVKAIETGRRDSQVEEVLFAARLALEEYNELETFLQQRTKKYPEAYLYWQQLLLMNVVRKDKSGIEKTRRAYRRAMGRMKYDKDTFARQLAMLEAARFYAEGRLEELLETHGKPAGGEWWRFVALIGLDRLDEAAKVLDQNELVGGTWNELAFSAALWAKGKKKQADALFQKAREDLLKGNQWDVALANVLEPSGSPALDRLDSMVLDYRQKAIVALVLAQREPAEAAELLVRARKLNWSLVFPYHLINKLTVPADK